MDIDEFLDREVSELGLQPSKSEKSIANMDMSEFKDKSSPLFDDIKTHLSNKNLKQAEQSYTQLWHLLAQQKLKWNRDLYEELLSLSRQFSSILNEAYSEMKRNADHIYELINKAKLSLKEGKKELAFQIYSEIKTIDESIPSIFFEEKKIIENQITDFHRGLTNVVDHELIKKASLLVQEINQLIGGVNISIRSNDMTNAILNYNKCTELYNQIPEGFLRHKNSIGMRLLDIYKIISIYTEISNLQKEFTMQLQFQQNNQANAAQQTTNLQTPLISRSANTQMRPIPPSAKSITPRKI